MLSVAAVPPGLDPEAPSACFARFFEALGEAGAGVAVIENAPDRTSQSEENESVPLGPTPLYIPSLAKCDSSWGAEEVAFIQSNGHFRLDFDEL